MSDQLIDHSPSGLGQMDSLSPECTPLKHKYDQCFNDWFKNYLDTSSSMNPEDSSRSRMDLWNTTGATAQSKLNKLSVLRERYDYDCGKLFAEYQACVKVCVVVQLTMQRAIQDKGLNGAIEKARKENPFPGHHNR